MRNRFLLPLLLAACGGGGGESTLDPCGANGECPAGFVCNPVDNLCYAEGTIHFDAGLPSVLETVIVTKPPARTRELRAEITFTGGPTFRCQLDGFVTWDVASPPGTSMQAPSLPASLASFAPRAGDKISGEIRLIDSTATPRYADFRLLYFFLRDFGIRSRTSNNDPPMPGRLPFTTRETYRFVDAQ